MTQNDQVQVKQETKKKFHCFTCGKEITFHGYTRVRYNLDGTEHKCNQSDRQAYAGHNRQGAYGSGYSGYSHKGKSRNARWWAWYWAYGPGKYHRDNEKRYSSEDYKQRRKAAEERYKSYRETYTTHDSKLSEAQALEILGLTKEVLSLHFKEKVQAIKDAFRKLALRFHPDRRPEGNAKKFIEVNDAYEMLMHRHNGGVK